eukprot:353072-Chlamydomonas_euryale.AAC.13
MGVSAARLAYQASQGFCTAHGSLCPWQTTAGGQARRCASPKAQTVPASMLIVQRQMRLSMSQMPHAAKSCIYNFSNICLYE